MSTIKKKVPEYKKGFKKLSTELLEYFESGNHEKESLDLYILRTNKEKLRDIWEEHKGQILEKWIKEYPGFRPFAWWEIDSPEPRLQVSGEGKPAWECGQSVKPWYFFGIPGDWTGFDKKNNKVIKTFDEANPPFFESEASCLQRHGMLTEAEKEIIAKDSGLLEPESILDIFVFGNE